MKQHLLGIDLGSSFVKVCLLEAATGRVTASVSEPRSEMEISSPQPGWAEQDPRSWWKYVVTATRRVVGESGIKSSSVEAIGISYQMHGLVAVDRSLQVLRPSIIWCDGRAVEIGERAGKTLNPTYIREHLLNAPGNFTASKLKWVQEHEPEIYDRIYKVMLPGDFIAMKLTGDITTTAPGLSEGTMWDFKEQGKAHDLMRHLKIDPELMADVVPTFGIQGKLTSAAAAELGLAPGIPLSYRAGDQPNNAFSLNALHPGEVAATAGTSGVIYAVTDKPVADERSRVNTFLHVNHQKEQPSLGVLLCVNGCGITNRWLRKSFFNDSLTYEDMNALAALAPMGSEELVMLPFGNGAERMLGNRNIGASFHGLDLVRHQQAHRCRAVQEGIVFALGYGFDILRQLGIQPRTIRAGNANMFQSEVFCETFANVTGTELQLFNVDGAQGAARGAGFGAGLYSNMNEVFQNVTCVKKYEPRQPAREAVVVGFERWKNVLTNELEKPS